MVDLFITVDKELQCMEDQFTRLEYPKDNKHREGFTYKSKQPISDGSFRLLFIALRTRLSEDGVKIIKAQTASVILRSNQISAK